jgi:hypothetical protein
VGEVSRSPRLELLGQLRGEQLHDARGARAGSHSFVFSRAMICAASAGQPCL